MSEASSAQETQQDLPFYLRGNFAPVSTEVTETKLAVSGSIPPELRGVYLRNGPNPRPGEDPGHWFFGHGMLHGVRLDEGKALWYRNRWVRTRSFVEDADFVKVLLETGEVDHTIGAGNTNVIGHAGRILALVESSYPTEMTGELETVGLCDFDGELRTSMTAHPKVCARTGELHFFGYRFLPPFLTYYRVDPHGKIVQREEIDVPASTMMHDFAITDSHVLFMDLPVVFDIERAMAEDKPAGAGMPYVWNDEYGARVGVMPRGGSNSDVRWFEIDPCYVFHPLNAFSENGMIVMDVARYRELWREGSDGFAPAHLHRWTIDLDGGRVSEEALDDLPIEFPRIDPRREGLRHRFGYAIIHEVDVGAQAMNLVKYDLQTGAREIHEFGDGLTPSEGVFVPASEKAGEDEGWILGYAYDAARDGSDLVILDASAVDTEPVARVHLPQRVPFGFHGNWVPDPA